MDDDRLRPPLYDDGKGSDLCVVELNEEDLDEVAPFPIDRQIVQSLLDNAPNYLFWCVIQKRKYQQAINISSSVTSSSSSHKRDDSSKESISSNVVENVSSKKSQ